MASGPWSIMAPNSFAVSGSRAAMVENKTAATMAVPKAAPTERENCTIAAPVPSIRCPATAWTVTCTTPMTVPMKQAIAPKTHGSSNRAQMRQRKSQEQQTKRRRHKTIGWKRRSAAGPRHQLAGDQRSDADAEHQRQHQQARLGGRRAADRAQIDRQERDRRHQARRHDRRPWQSARQTEGSRNSAGGMSGEVECFSCQISASSASAPNAEQARDHRQACRRPCAAPARAPG